MYNIMTASQVHEKYFYTEQSSSSQLLSNLFFFLETAVYLSCLEQCRSIFSFPGSEHRGEFFLENSVPGTECFGTFLHKLSGCPAVHGKRMKIMPMLLFLSQIWED